MSKDNEPSQWAEQIAEIQRMIRDNEPAIRQIRQIRSLIRGSEPIRRQIEPIAQAAAQFAYPAHWPKIGLPLPLQLAAAMDTAMRELKPTQLHATAHPPTLEVSVAIPTPTVITGSGGVVLPKPSLRGQGTVENRRSGLAALSEGQIVFLVLVWLYAFVLPWFGSALPPEFHQVLSDSYATVAIALTITWRMLDKHK